MSRDLEAEPVLPGPPFPNRRRTMRARTLLLWLLVWSLAAPALGQTPGIIEHPGKIGVGAWPARGESKMLADIDRLGAAWFYDWLPTFEAGDPRFVPMIWGNKDMARARQVEAGILLTFNEPDHPQQANMSVDAALGYWPELAATGKRLGSPATTTWQEVGERSWLGRFMTGADERGYRVDFIAVHYYAVTPDIAAFREYLERIHAAYGKPIWVTEWALADWKNPGRFTPAQQAEFLTAGANMLDELDYVERQAWFGLYEGLGGWTLGSGLVEPTGELSTVGEAYRRLFEAGAE